MIIFTTVATLQVYISKQKKDGKSIGFVPTMGALHTGHLSLVKMSQKHCQTTVVSIFVNPTQFNNPTDFDKYPITVEQDCLLLEKQGTDALFLPSLQEIYPNGTTLKKHFDLGNLENVLDGKYRPGHFQGVCQVVERLLEIVHPTHLFLGQKDLQQCMVLKRLTVLMPIDTQITMAPIQREANGLAMSSRNLRLNNEQLLQAAAIYEQLIFIKENIDNISLDLLKQKAADKLLEAGFNKIDYIEIVETGTLKSIGKYKPATETAILIAAFLGDVRLIDNMVL